ncbi:MAG: hypothetical protein UV83_C0008G0023 [candidate division WWE3 bacterium GW2011_GWE2_43_18]|nr:MAG: hypothetical protein UV83_C0008G0023 [candidate division WWE3 bacterium GW2011_GWE2_43_18]
MDLLTIGDVAIEGVPDPRFAFTTALKYLSSTSRPQLLEIH